jgi:hypothetical protein
MKMLSDDYINNNTGKQRNFLPTFSILTTEKDFGDFGVVKGFLSTDILSFVGPTYLCFNLQLFCTHFTTQ